MSVDFEALLNVESDISSVPPRLHRIPQAGERYALEERVVGASGRLLTTPSDASLKGEALPLGWFVASRLARDDARLAYVAPLILLQMGRQRPANAAPRRAAVTPRRARTPY